MTNQDPSVAAEGIRAAAARSQRWDQGDIEVGAVEDLDRAGCLFFRASNRSRTDTAPVEYAAMPDGTLVGGDRESAKEQVGSILKTCGADAPADWWAQVVSRYAGSGGVLVNENVPSAIRKLTKAGVLSHAPVLRQEGASTLLTYFSHDYESSRTLAVTAVLDAQGRLSVQTKEIGATP